MLCDDDLHPGTEINNSSGSLQCIFFIYILEEAHAYGSQVSPFSMYVIYK